ncbi:MAG: NAD+ kinase [Bacteriovoracaceae bacterium]|jgi:NAD+ kinase
MSTKRINNIGIVLKPSHMDDFPNVLTNLIRWLTKRQKKVFLLDKEEKRFEGSLSSKTISQIKFEDEKYVFNKTDLVISLGGDGTLLGVSRKINSQIPVFSVNLGRLGFITEFSKNDFYEKLNVILLGKYEVFKKNLYSIEVKRKNQKPIKELFFNDAVFTKNDLARMFTLAVEADGEHIYNISGDGLIISSTYGSTAYSLAAGGPIVHPAVKALILTPICAHSLTHRPLVIPDNQSLKVSLMENIDTVNITLDGQTCVHLAPKDTVKISKENRKTITLIKNTERTYFHTLKEKFVHGRREVY